MPDGSAALPLREYWPRRFTLVGLCALATVICYVDRINISVAVIPMAEDLGWDKTRMGMVLSAFFYGYLATQVLGGWLADRFGGKVVLGAGVLLWSLFTILTPPAAMTGLVVLFLTRVAMGIGEGVAFPSIYSLFSRWLPAQERSRAIALNMSGIPLGTILALVLTPWIVVRWGWETAFYAFGAVGFLWWIFWHLWGSASPDQHPSISRRELEHIRAGTLTASEIRTVPWRALLSHSAVWAIIVSHFCNNWGAYVLLSWLPTYVNQALGVELAAVGLYTMLPFLMSAVGMNVAGWFADRLLERGLSITAVRKLLQTIGFGGAATVLLVIGHVTSAPLAMFLMSIATFLAAMAISGFGANHLDIAPRYAGVLMGISNTAGTVPGIVGVTVTGMILDATQSWVLVFSLAAAVYLVGLVVWLLFATGERVFD